MGGGEAQAGVAPSADRPAAAPVSCLPARPPSCSALPLPCLSALPFLPCSNTSRTLPASASPTADKGGACCSRGPAPGGHCSSARAAVEPAPGAAAGAAATGHGQRVCSAARAGGQCGLVVWVSLEAVFCKGTAWLAIWGPFASGQSRVFALACLDIACPWKPAGQTPARPPACLPACAPRAGRAK
jgi:hypothetical protein